MLWFSPPFLPTLFSPRTAQSFFGERTDKDIEKKMVYLEVSSPKGSLVEADKAFREEICHGKGHDHEDDDPDTEESEYGPIDKEKEG